MAVETIDRKSSSFRGETSGTTQLLCRSTYCLTETAGGQHSVRCQLPKENREQHVGLFRR